MKPPALDLQWSLSLHVSPARLHRLSLAVALLKARNPKAQIIETNCTTFSKIALISYAIILPRRSSIDARHLLRILHYLMDAGSLRIDDIVIARI